MATLNNPRAHPTGFYYVGALESNITDRGGNFEKKTENTSDFLGLLLQLVKKDLKMVTETLIKQKTFPFKHKHFVESPDEQRQRRDTR